MARFSLTHIDRRRARASRRDRGRSAGRGPGLQDEAALHVAESGDELGSRVLGEPRLRRLLHRRRRVPARYRASRRRADLRHLRIPPPRGW